MQGTLLNLLFGTSFEIMDRDKGRNQTTKVLYINSICAQFAPAMLCLICFCYSLQGVWLSKAQVLIIFGFNFCF